MKITKRLLLGIASSVLLTTGWLRAAEGLDPTSSLLAADGENPPFSGAPDCAGNLCDFSEVEQ